MLTVVIMLYITLPGIICLLTGNLIPLNNFYSCPPPPQTLAITILLSVPISTAFLDYIYVCVIPYCVRLCLTPLSIILQVSFYLIANGRVFIFIVCIYIYGGNLVAKSWPTLVTPWTVACQPPLSKGFSRQKFWSTFPCPPPGDLPDRGIKP